MDQLRELLTFWFSKDAKPKWFVSDDAFDKILKDKYYLLFKRATHDQLDYWKQSPKGYLGLIILLDQFSRNFYRNMPQAFDCDNKALNYAKKMIEKGWDETLLDEERAFVYLPFEHSENLLDQELCLMYFSRLLDAEASWIEYAERHHYVIKKFGRFPHRNNVLGRQSTPEEEAFLKDHPFGF